MIKTIQILTLILSLTGLNSLAIEKHFPDLKADFSENIDLYCIEKEDSLVAIAAQNKVSPSFLLYLNPELSSHENFYAGKTIKLPGQNVKSFINSQSRYLNKLILQLGAKDYKTRSNAQKQLIDKDWLAVPALFKALKHQDVEIRGNAKDSLRAIFSTFKKLNALTL